MTKLQGVDAVVAHLNEQIAKLEAEKVFDRIYLNLDLVRLLTDIRDGLVDHPDWSQVLESNLRADLEHARSWAVRLEQELARAEGQLASSFRWFVFKESGSWWAALRSADGTIRGHWRSFKSRRKAVRFARRHSGEDL